MNAWQMSRGESGRRRFWRGTVLPLRSRPVEHNMPEMIESLTGWAYCVRRLNGQIRECPIEDSVIECALIFVPSVVTGQADEWRHKENPFDRSRRFAPRNSDQTLAARRLRR